jgi:uncharacterized repeat protein (TIGR04076 family)
MYKDGQEYILDIDTEKLDHEGLGLTYSKVDMPDGFCVEAWETIYPSIRTLFHGGDFPHFEEKGIAVIGCPDGIRPVIFKIERL